MSKPAPPPISSPAPTVRMLPVLKSDDPIVTTP
jgi:hypothetical protein